MAAGIGEQELELLKYVAEGGPQSVGQVAEGFGVPRALARSTVLTMMERLRRKGHLTRRRSDGVYQYKSTLPIGELLHGAVRTFVEGALAGSVSPVVNYLSERAEVSDQELADLERLVERLHSQRKGE
jgi:predicted transcriptional regulator